MMAARNSGLEELHFLELESAEKPKADGLPMLFGCFIQKTRWWFQIFFNVHPYLGEMIPNLTCAYFSQGVGKSVKKPQRLEN